LRVHLDQAMAFERALPRSGGRLVDLGTGGGVPALPLLLARPDFEGLLVEAMHKRATFLVWAVGILDFGGRVAVRHERAEQSAHDPALRAAFDIATARGFGPPAVTAECAAGFIRPGGALVVSEPPNGPDRWPVDGLASLGFGPARRLGPVVSIPLLEPAPPDVPRPSRVLVKRPRF
jgi:16S rRNA (guanine527-N7)-methyltransferase